MDNFFLLFKLWVSKDNEFYIDFENNIKNEMHSKNYFQEKCILSSYLPVVCFVQSASYLGPFCH
jgi:hypothetical protein